jgi:hypothetical protein
MFGQLHTELDDLRMVTHTLGHTIEGVLISCARDATISLVTRALGFERPGATSRGFVVAHGTSVFDGGKAIRQFFSGGTTVVIGLGFIDKVFLRIQAQFAIRGGVGLGGIDRDAVGFAGLHLFAVIVALVRYHVDRLDT